MNGWELLAIAVALAVAGYVFDLWRRPFTRCLRCGGTGRVRGSTSKRWGPCSCAGKPPRLRVGAQLVRPGLRKKGKS